jgi:hypothetical protein
MGIKALHRDPLISLGTAPLGNPQFRAAVFEQLGTDRLEAAVITDIIGRKDAHSIALDSEAVETIKKARLHRKVATTIFFESNGGKSEPKQSSRAFRKSALLSANPRATSETSKLRSMGYCRRVITCSPKKPAIDSASRRTSTSVSTTARRRFSRLRLTS